MTDVQTIKTIYWVLVSISLLFILGPVIYLYKTQIQQGCPNTALSAGFILAGLIFYTVAIILDKTLVKEGYSHDPSIFSRYNYTKGDGIYRKGGSDVKKEDVGSFDQARVFNGIGDLSTETRNNPTENKIPNLKLQSATDLVDYTTIRNSLGNSFEGGPFSFGAEAVTRVKSNPNGF